MTDGPHGRGKIHAKVDQAGNFISSDISHTLDHGRASLMRSEQSAGAHVTLCGKRQEVIHIALIHVVEIEVKFQSADEPGDQSYRRSKITLKRLQGLATDLVEIVVNVGMQHQS